MGLLRKSIFVLLAALGLAAQETNAPPQKKFQISGTVVSAFSGEPLAQAKVFISSTSARNVMRTMMTGEDGRFLFKNVASGKYSLIAERRGYSQQAYEEHDFYSVGIAAGTEKESENLIFRLQPECSIAGRITGDQSDPVRTGQVMLFEKGMENGRRKITLHAENGIDDQGFYRFGHLAPGIYFVAVSAQPWYAQHNPRIVPDPSSTNSGLQPNSNDNLLDVAYPLTYYPEATEAEDASPILLHPGDRYTANITLSAVPALHLRITNVSSDTPQNIHGMVMQISLGGSQSVVLQSQIYNISPGIMELAGVPPGHYALDLQTSNPSGEPQNSEHQTIDVSSNGEIDARESVAAATVSGTVKFEGAATMPEQASIQFRSLESDRGNGGPVSAAGEFNHILLNAGRYEIFVPNAAGFIVRSVFATGAKVAGRTVAISGSEPVQLTVVSSKGFGRVDGIVMRGNKPVAGAMVVLVPQDPERDFPLFRRDESDSDGTFSLTQVLPGKYTVLAIENGWDLEWANPAVLLRYMQKGEVVQIVSNGKYKITAQLQ